MPARDEGYELTLAAMREALRTARADASRLRAALREIQSDAIAHAAECDCCQHVAEEAEHALVGGNDG